MCEESVVDVALPMEQLLIAVDGGATKTEMVLIRPSGELIRRIMLPGCNPNVCTVEGVFEILRQGIGNLLEKYSGIAAVFAGCSGFQSGGSGEKIETMLRQVYPQFPVACKSDIYNVLVCAQDPQNAIAVISGTGSVVYATRDGQLCRYGGGGWRLDPLGSGYELGRAALQAALEHRDGTGPDTAMTELVEHKLGGKVWDYIQEIHSAQPAWIASCAPIVVESWRNGDSQASQIIAQNTKRLADLINMAAQDSSAHQVVMAGSLLTACEPYADQVIKQLHPGLSALVLKHPPVWGACLQSATLAKYSPPNVEIFMNGYKQEV